MDIIYDIWYDIYDNIIYDMKYTIYEFFRYKEYKFISKKLLCFCTNWYNSLFSIKKSNLSMI